MRNRNATLVKRDSMISGTARCNMLATLTGLDPLPVWQWVHDGTRIDGVAYVADSYGT